MDTMLEEMDRGLDANNAAVIEAAMAATAAEKPQGGGSAAVAYEVTTTANETKMVPSGCSTKYIFIGGDKKRKSGGGKEYVRELERPKGVERLQHDGE